MIKVINGISFICYVSLYPSKLPKGWLGKVTKSRLRSRNIAVAHRPTSVFRTTPVARPLLRRVRLQKPRPKSSRRWRETCSLLFIHHLHSRTRAENESDPCVRIMMRAAYRADTLHVTPVCTKVASTAVVSNAPAALALEISMRASRVVAA